MASKKKYQDGGTIKIRDNRKTNIVTGLPLSSKARKHANIPTELVQVIIDSAKKYKVNPYTALAIGLQESNYHPDHQKNPFMLGNYNPQGHIIDESMQFMAEKEKYARGLGKKKEEDVIQAYNGYGSLAEMGNMYGIDTNQNPIEMVTNPVYGKTVKQLRDSVIMQNPEIKKLVEGNKSSAMKTYKKGGKISISDLNNLTDEEVYSLGGWLKENAVPLLSTVAGGVLTATGVGAGAGVGLLASGIGGMVGNATSDEPENIVANPTVMPRTVGKKNMTPNVMSFKKGGGLQSISKNKAKEMLKNPPHGKKLSKKQEKTFRAIAHGWSPSYESGGNMNDDLMQIEGPSHEQGGVQFMDNAELEGGETVRNNVVNSDSIIIDKDTADIYGLPGKAVGKSVAAYSKMVQKQFEGREGDPFAMKSREMSMNNITKMSDELGQLFNNGNQYKRGGEIDGEDDTPRMRRGQESYNGVFEKDDQPTYWEQLMLNWRNKVATNTNARLTNLGLPRSNDEYYYDNNGNLKTKTGNANITSDSLKGKFEYTPESDNKGSAVTKGISTGSTKTTTPYENIYESGYNKGLPKPADDYIRAEDAKTINKPVTKINTSNISMPDLAPNNKLVGNLKPNKTVAKSSFRDKLNLGSARDIATTALGVAPLALGAFQAARAAKERPDKVSLGRIHYDPMNPEFIDPQYQLDQVRESFATGNEQMSQVSKKDMLRRRIQSATEESKARSGVLGSVQAVNTQMLNQARQFNTQNKFRSDALNAELGIQEENINAANKGAWETNRDFQLNNLGTMAGEFARDLRMEGAQERYRDRWLNETGRMFPGQKYSEETGWENTSGLAAPPLPSPAHVYGTDLRVKPYVPMQEPSPVTFPPSEIDDGALQYGSFRMPKARLGWMNRNMR